MRVRRLVAGAALSGALVVAPVTLAGAGEATGDEPAHSEEVEHLIHEIEALDAGIGELPPEQREELIHELEVLAEENGGTHFDAECIPILIEGGSVDDCHEAPNLILPETNEIIWGGASFLVLFVLLAKLAYPPVKKMMEERTEKIQGDIDEAENAKAEANTILDEYRAQLADAKAEAGRIIEEARQSADALKSDHEQRLQGELAETRQRATADIEAAKQQAIADLRDELGGLAVDLAGRVVQHSLDQGTHQQLIDDFIDQVGSPN